MDTIETFLDNMFAPYPATPRLIEARSELRAMMEDLSLIHISEPTRPY